MVMRRNFGGGRPTTPQMTQGGTMANIPTGAKPRGIPPKAAPAIPGKPGAMIERRPPKPVKPVKPGVRPRDTVYSHPSGRFRNGFRGMFGGRRPRFF